MKKSYTSFAAGLLIGAVMFGGTTAYAAGILAERSAQPIYVDGQKIQMEAYNINGNNYVKLRDIGQAVGFNVYWQDGVRVDSGAPYTGQAPAGASASGTVTLPTDGSQYIPQAGDVILCDNGTEYTITDVSRWDKNAFADGPLEALPDYDPDWDLLPQPELPEVEARRFTSDGKDYLFVRNLYETKRMLYTLYEAIVDNPETWQDGKPVAFPSGNPKVRISLTIPEGTEPQFFWPWRESQITNLFNSCPPGHYRMEAWDVYRNGVFQRTEYNIYID